MWEAQGLMTRVHKTSSRTMWNRNFRSTIALTEEWLQMSLSTSSLNGDVTQKVERSFHRREEQGWMPRVSNFSEKTGNQETNTTGSCSVRSKKKTLISTSNIRREASETAVLNEKATGAPNFLLLSHKDVGGNTVLLTCESKTSLWHKKLHWTTPAWQLNRKANPLACEKKMDWWTAST